MDRFISECGPDVRQGILYGFGQGVMGVVITSQSTRPQQRVFLNHKLYGHRRDGVPVYEGVLQGADGQKREKFILPNSKHPPEMKPELT